MSGSVPRIYINGNSLNTEHTYYWKRYGTDGDTSQGAVTGHRSDPSAHQSSATHRAHTYYTKPHH